MTDTAKTNAPQQVEAARFRSAISESLLQQMQGNINLLLSVALPVGSIIHSLLTESQFQAIVGTGWIMADGRNVSTSEFASVTGYTTVPDLRGLFLRGKNNGRSAATGNPDGDLGLGTGQDDGFESHFHNISGIQLRTEGGSSGPADYYEIDNGTDWSVKSFSTGNATVSVGVNETRPKNVTTNIFIRVN